MSDRYVCRAYVIMKSYKEMMDKTCKMKFIIVMMMIIIGHGNLDSNSESSCGTEEKIYNE